MNDLDLNPKTGCLAAAGVILVGVIGYALLLALIVWIVCSVISAVFF